MAVGWQVEVAPALVFLTSTFIPEVTIKAKLVPGELRVAFQA